MSHLLQIDMKTIDQIIYDGQTAFFRDICQVGVTCCCLRACMPEQGLDMAKA